jgi:hypothetical protein
VQQWCYTYLVPTTHPRIALTRDPELDEALKAAAVIFGPSQPTSRIARELILRGARDLLANTSTELDLRLDEKGATPARGSIGEMLAVVAEMGPADPSDPRPLSDALAQMRDEEDR